VGRTILAGGIPETSEEHSVIPGKVILGDKFGNITLFDSVRKIVL